MFEIKPPGSIQRQGIINIDKVKDCFKFSGETSGSQGNLGNQPASDWSINPSLSNTSQEAVMSWSMFSYNGKVLLDSPLSPFSVVGF